MKMKLIRKLIFSAVSAILIFPALTLAQWDAGKSNAQLSGLPEGKIQGIALNVMMWLLGMVGFIGVIGFAISGILYLTAAGSEDRIEKAKKAMTWSIIGVIVALMGYVIIQAVDAMLRGSHIF